MITVWNDSREDDFRFIVSGAPTSLQFDIDDWILRSAYPESYELNIVTAELPDGDLGEEYEALVEARGGNDPYSFEVTDGSLPSGLTLDEDTGEITGIPTTEWEYVFTIECTDSSDDTDDQEYVVIIGQPTDVTDEDLQTPSNFALIGNYPNPFNNSTIIKFRLADAGNIRLDIFNLLGQKIETLLSGTMSAGEHELVWNGNNVPSGIYFYRLVAGEKSTVKKMALIK
jgi:hypothetical protein